MRVRHGQLLGVIGRARRAGGLVICPALVGIDDPTEGHPLAEFLRPDLPGAVDFADPPDALWVRARLPGLFGYRPLQVADGRDHLLNAGFVAADPDSGVAVPFACVDTACADCRLVFSRAEPAGLRALVARVFWGLVASAGAGDDFRAEDVVAGQWVVDESDGSVGEQYEVFEEVGRAGGEYYAETGYLCDDDSWNFERADWSPRAWHWGRSRPARRVRNCRA